MNTSSPKGQIEVVCGGMFSGKTEELIRRIRRAQIANKKILVFKPIIDNRYHENLVVSHNKEHINAIVVSNISQIQSALQKQSPPPDIIAIDECQFFDLDIIPFVNHLANTGIRVIIAGLDMDSNQVGFGPMPQLMAIAESITKLHAICVSCGELASYSYRTIKTNAQILIGNQNAYQPLCRTCFNLQNTP